MALTLEVTNTTEGVVGRAGHRFDPGEPKEVRVDSARLYELQDCPYLSISVKDADYLSEIPEGMDVSANATPDALEFARQKGVDIYAVSGSGKDGRVTKSDVNEHLSKVRAAGGGPEEGVVSTFSSVEEQKKAEAEALESLKEAEQRGVEHEVVASEPAVPDQTASTPASERSAGDVEQAEQAESKG